MYFNPTLRGSSLLNIDGISKRVIYSDSEQNATTGHRKIQLFQQTILSPMYFNQTLRGSSSLNTRCIFIKVIYSESGKHILQHGSQSFDFHDILFWT